MRADETLAYLFQDGWDALQAPMAAWLAESRHFAVFAERYRDKIRKKIRITRELDAAQDLQHELETAYLLARENKFSVAYEPYVHGGGRPFGPDFAVTYTTSFTFNVEATHLRASVESDQQDHASALHLMAERLSEATCSKLYQLMPGMMNVVVIGVDHWVAGLSESHIAAALLRLKQRAESGDANLLMRQGFRDASAFFKHYERLSSIVVRSINLQAPAVYAPIHWANRQGKHALTSKVITLLLR